MVKKTRVPNRPGNPRPRGRKSGRTRSDTVVVRRRELVSNILGTSSFFASSVPIGAGSFTAGTLAALYTEYRYLGIRIELVPRCSSTTLGNVFAGWFLAPPSSIPDLAAASQLSRFNAGPAFGRNTSSTYDAVGRSRRWYTSVVAPVPQQELDPDIIQTWAFIGSDQVQQGVIASDVYVTYTLELRGSRATLAGQALTAGMLDHFTLHSPDDDTDTSEDEPEPPVTQTSAPQGRTQSRAPGPSIAGAGFGYE